MTTPELERLCKEARQCLRERNFPRALELFQQVADGDERSTEAHEGLATAHFLNGEYQAAIEHYVRITQIDPRQTRPLINLGAIYNRMGEYQRAIDVLRRGLARERKCAEGYYNLGIAHRKLNQLKFAVDAYREAIRLDPQFADAYQNLGNVYLEMGNPQQAVASYKKALEIRPEFDRARRGLEQAEQALQQNRRAISPFGRLVGDNPGNIKAVPTFGRELTAAERAEDRLTVREAARDIEHLAKECLAQIQDELESSLTLVGRHMAQASVSPGALLQANDDLLAAIEKWRALRKMLRRRLLELRAHEERMNTPGLKPTENNAIPTG